MTRTFKIRKMPHHLRQINGIYQYQRKIPDDLSAICARITRKTTLSKKQVEQGQTIPTLEWFIRSTGTGNLAEAEKTRDDKIDPDYRALIKRAETYADPDAIAQAMNADPPDTAGISFPQLSSLTPAQVSSVLASIDTHHEREQARLDTLNSLMADIRDMLRSSPVDQLATARDNILGAMAATEKEGKPVLPEDVIQAWKVERIGDHNPPSDKAIKNKARKVERMFGWMEKNRPGFLAGCRDMRRVNSDDLAAYRLHLYEEGVARDHLIDLKALFGVAYRAVLVRPNPAEDITYPGRGDTTRLDFLVHDQRNILVRVRDPQFVEMIATKGQMERGIGAVAVVRWTHWVAAFTSAGMKELVKIKISSIIYDDEHGVWTIFIPGSKTQYRPRRLVLHDSLIREGFLDYVEMVREKFGPDSHLFPGWNEDQAGVIANLVLRDPDHGLGITDPLLSHYSWRHVVGTRLDKVPGVVSATLANYVTGHAPMGVKGTGIKGRHYIHPDLDDVKRAIDQLIDPTV